MTAQDNLGNLVRDLLAGRKIDVVRFVDELLLLADTLGEVRCSPADDDRLRFAIPGAAPFDVPLDRARSKLRMLCARLAVLCEGGSETTPYGGQGNIPDRETRESSTDTNVPPALERNVQFVNTAAEVGFTLQGRRSSKGTAPTADRMAVGMTDQETTR